MLAWSVLQGQSLTTASRWAFVSRCFIKLKGKWPVSLERGQQLTWMHVAQAATTSTIRRHRGRLTAQVHEHWGSSQQWFPEPGIGEQGGITASLEVRRLRFPSSSWPHLSQRYWCFSSSPFDLHLTAIRISAQGKPRCSPLWSLWITPSQQNVITCMDFVPSLFLDLICGFRWFGCLLLTFYLDDP